MPARPARPPRRRRPPPQPLEVDDVKVVATGTALWLVAFVVLLVFRGRLAEAGQEAWLWTCLAGFGLGLLGTEYCRRRRHRLRRDARRRAEETQAPPIEPLT